MGIQKGASKIKGWSLHKDILVLNFTVNSLKLLWEMTKPTNLADFHMKCTHGLGHLNIICQIQILNTFEDRLSTPSGMPFSQKVIKILF